jgi:hypothetical protein
MMPWLDSVQTSALAQAIGNSRWATAVLSSLHLVGFTLLMGSTLISNLRLLGAVLPDRPIDEVTRPAARAAWIALAISAATGSLLFVPRASGAVANPTFQLKMLLLATAVGVQALALPRVAHSPLQPAAARVTGAAGLVLWLGLALAGCAFILFE